MFRIDDARIKVDIKLDNGIYCFYGDSGEGKTRLAKLFRNYSIKFPVASYSYNDLVLDIPFDVLVKPGKQKVLVLDRYDLYKTMFTEQIKEFANTGIVLIDCKGDPLIECEVCFIRMEIDSIEVSTDAVYDF